MKYFRSHENADLTFKYHSIKRKKLMNQSFVSSSVMGCHQEAELWAGHWVSSRPASCRPHSSTGAMTWPGLRVGPLLVLTPHVARPPGTCSPQASGSGQWLENLLNVALASLRKRRALVIGVLRGNVIFFKSCSLMLQMISIYKVTDFAPLLLL